MNAVQQPEFASVFNWAPPRSRRGVLVSCIAGSAILHALCFYLFQIIYPPTVSLLPPPARINIITPDSEGGRVLLRWIEAEDPALSSTTQRPPNAAALQPPKPEYVPSFANHLPALRPLASAEPDLRAPSSLPPGPVPQHRAPVQPQNVQVPTTIQFRDEDSLGAPLLPQLQFTASRNDSPAPAEFRVAIDEHGIVRNCLLEISSGDSAIDEQARRYLLLCRFEKYPDSLTWTTATIEWGNDFASPAKALPKSAAP